MPKFLLPQFATLDLIVVAIILLALCFWLVVVFSEWRLKKTLQKTADASLFESQFKCVILCASNSACSHAITQQTKPILLSKAPMLPLAGCDAQKCECILMQQDDRRMGLDRRDAEVLDKERKSIYAKKRRLKDRRRASIREFLLPQYRTLTKQV